MTNGGPASDSETVFADVLAAASALADLPDAARVEAWGSSALSVWAEDPDADALTAEFLEWLQESNHPDAPLLLLSVAASVELPAAVVASARTRAGETPPWLDHVMTAVPTRAWRIVEGDDAALGIGFSHGDGSASSLLADVVDGRLDALVVAPGPEELFDEAEDVVDPEPLEVTDAARTVVRAWREAIAAGIPPAESVLVNHRLARRRLETILETSLDDLVVNRPLADAADPMSSDERAELDDWARRILVGALGAAAVSGPFPDGVLDAVVRERHADYPREEREAFAALEWADWLGAVLGLVRAGVGADASPRALVDHINRCPEITSAIPRADRPYYEWAFQHVVALWQRLGLVDGDRRLLPAGVTALPAALAAAWGGGDQ